MKTIDKLFLILAAVLIIVGVTVGLTLGWDYPDTGYNTLEITAEEPFDGDFSAVTVALDSLDVNVYSTGETTLSFVASGFASDRLEITQSGGSVRITEKRQGFFERLFKDEYASFIVWVPENWIGTLDISSESGDVGISGLYNAAATAALSTTSGRIYASDMKLPGLRLTSTSGDISVNSQRGGSVAAKTTSGTVYFNDAKIDAAELSSASGNISLYNTEISGALTLRTTSGEMDLDDVSAGSITAESTSGDLELDELDTQSLSFSSTSGSLSGELLHSAEFAVSFTTVSGDISGVRETSEGTRTLTVKTVSGDIDLDD